MPKTSTPAASVKLSTVDEVMLALRKRYKADAWAVLENVADATGSRATRWADALAIGLWPSRGIEVHGFEIKLSRRDALRELKQPQKAEAVASYCDYWWFVLGDATIVRADEVPSTWGVLAPTGTVEALRVVRYATKMEARALDRNFVASVLRRAAASFDPSRIRDRARQELREELASKIVSETTKDLERDLRNVRAELESARAKITRYEEQLREVSDGRMYLLPQALALVGNLSRWQGDHRRLNALATELGPVQETLREVSSMLDSLKAQEGAS